MKTGLCLMLLVLTTRLEAGPRVLLVDTEDSHRAADYSIQKGVQLDKDGCRPKFAIGTITSSEDCCLELPVSGDECCHDRGDRDGTNRTRAHTRHPEFPYGPDGVYCMAFNEHWEKEKDSVLQGNTDYLYKS